MEWLRRSLSRSQKTIIPSHTSTQSKQLPPDKEEEEEEKIFGITNELIDFIKTFTLETFKNFPLLEEDRANSSGNIQRDLSGWQERHAILVLSKVKELSHLRFKLCPGWLKERQFWRIYFTLVKSYTAEYELRAIQAAKLKQMMSEKENTPTTTGYEIEMSDTKGITSDYDIESGKE